VEDPVEYRLPRVNQVQIQEKIDLSFARVLRTALRQDPDVVLVGEMRDLETAQIGLRAAITGHLVLSTLHTNSAIGTVSRLLDMGAPGYLLASSLTAVVAQRLLRRVCEKCRIEVEPTPQQSAWLEKYASDRDELKLYAGKGCNRCGGSGFHGRIGVYELLELNSDMVSALREEDLQGFEDAVKTVDGFRSLAQRGLDYVCEGITSLDEVIRVAGDSELDRA
jgi:MSHA biogenesis protein MshE